MNSNTSTPERGSSKKRKKIDEGIGPTMNLDSCAGCHLQPAMGGSSPAVNPQFGFASKDGGTDTVPSFITENGPVREARFIRNRDGRPDGGVHALFTISGREGAEGCSIAQPDFATELANRNVIFRIPTPVFGAGLIEMIPDGASCQSGRQRDSEEFLGHPRTRQLPGVRPRGHRTDEP